MRTSFAPALACGLALALAACAAPGPPKDFNARAACRDYQSLVRDLQAGIVAAREVRPRLQAIDTNAQQARDPLVRRHARRLLQAATAGDLPTETALELVRACTPHIT